MLTFKLFCAWLDGPSHVIHGDKTDFVYIFVFNANYLHFNLGMDVVASILKVPEFKQILNRIDETRTQISNNNR